LQTSDHTMCFSCLYGNVYFVNDIANNLLLQLVAQASNYISTFIFAFISQEYYNFIFSSNALVNYFLWSLMKTINVLKCLWLINSNKYNVWRFLIIYENGIPGVMTFMLSRDDGIWCLKHYYKYVRTKLKTKKTKGNEKVVSFV
jgi:hypothetical protein